jgi:hypothetical protein
MMEEQGERQFSLHRNYYESNSNLGLTRQSVRHPKYLRASTGRSSTNSCGDRKSLTSVSCPATASLVSWHAKLYTVDTCVLRVRRRCNELWNQKSTVAADVFLTNNCTVCRLLLAGQPIFDITFASAPKLLTPLFPILEN